MEDVFGKGTWSCKCNEFQRKWFWDEKLFNQKASCALVNQLGIVGGVKHTNHSIPQPEFYLCVTGSQWMFLCKEDRISFSLVLQHIRIYHLQICHYKIYLSRRQLRKKRHRITMFRLPFCLKTDHKLLMFPYSVPLSHCPHQERANNLIGRDEMAHGRAYTDKP